jgi:predicted acyltransferase
MATRTQISPAPASAPYPAPPAAVDKPGRLVSLDVFRGLVIAGMILVTDPGTYSAIYWPLRHAEWNGWTPTDMIFPAFLLMIGIALTLSFQARLARRETRTTLARHIVQRSVILTLLGLLLNGFPSFHLHTLRLPGILQHIALCYLCGGLLYLAVRHLKISTRVSVIAAVAVLLIAGYWAALELLPVPGFGPGRLDSLGTISAYVDRSVFSVPHLWLYGTTPGYGVTYDPDGILVSLSSLSQLLIGILAGEWLRTRHSGTKKALALAVAGLILLIAGRALNPWLVINKKIWTSTFVLFSSGFSLLAFACLYWLIDLRRSLWWTAPTLIFGTNAILAFALSSVLTTLTAAVHVDSAGTLMNLRRWGYQTLFLPWLSPIHASLAFAILIVLINLALIWPLYRRRIFLRL